MDMCAELMIRRLRIEVSNPKWHYVHFFRLTYLPFDHFRQSCQGQIVHSTRVRL
jgi:hypothetical protein